MCKNSLKASWDFMWNYNWIGGLRRNKCSGLSKQLPVNTDAAACGLYLEHQGSRVLLP